MYPAFAQKLDLHIRKTHIKVQKIDGSALETFKMVIADLKMKDKVGKSRFFWEIFLVADTKFKPVLGMLFFTTNNVDVSFGEGTLTWKSYTTNKALPTTKQVQIVDPKEFVIAALDMGSKTFIVYMAIQEREEMPVHSKKQDQVGALIFNEAPTEVPIEYSDYSNVFLVENMSELPENTGINKHAINLEENKQLFFGSIYSLSQVELETLKTYI